MIYCDIWFPTYKSPLNWTISAISPDNDSSTRIVGVYLKSPYQDWSSLSLSCSLVFLYCAAFVPLPFSLFPFLSVCWLLCAVQYQSGVSNLIDFFFYSTKNRLSLVAFLACKMLFCVFSEGNGVQGKQCYLDLFINRTCFFIVS